MHENKKIKRLTQIAVIFAVMAVISWNTISRGSGEQPINDDLFDNQIVSDEWLSLFDGETLDGWEIVRYGGEGEPFVRNGSLILPRAPRGTMTGVCWVGDSLPAINYVIHYEARRVEGIDIFAALTFPYGNTFATLIFSGWRNMVNGLSSIDGYDASGNETTQIFSFRNNQWYPVQLRVTNDSIRATVGHERVVDLATAGKDIHLRDDTLDTGLTLWTYHSTGEIRNIRIKKL